ncbi:T-complex protein 11-like protein 2 [Microtus ochrogaster]|uniref:T-complex protein 11-like protein 2 n=1 Tax=Microtus ochrogaster TaxID=79684 RepID=A0A8J6G728_MICOH|nr:T-complex protein 11-like protein 2 [Microtus ochrogaster]
MPLNDEKQCVNEQSDVESSPFSEGMASLSDFECSRQSFTSDFSSKSSSPDSTSPPSGVMFDDVMAAAKSLSDMTLAHEIAVNENFQLKQNAVPENSIGYVHSSPPPRLMQLSGQRDLNRDCQAQSFCSAAITVHGSLEPTMPQILLSFLAPGANSLHNQICEVLDIDLIRQQAEHNAVDIQGLANYVITTMGKMCAPVRDDDIRELKATTNIVEMLRQIFRVLDLMRMDMTNFVIRTVRPHIQNHLVEYERNKFQEILEGTPNALSQTTEWLKESIDEEFLSETAAPGTEQSSPPSLSPLLVLNNCYLKLLWWDYQTKVLPETLVTDGTRLQELTEKLNQLKMIACLSLITNNMVGAVTEGLPELASRLKRISAVLLEGMNKETFNLKEALDSIGVQTCAEVNKALEERGSPTLNTEVQANLIGQFSSLEKKDNPVCTLMDKRIQVYMRSLLCLSSTHKSLPPVPLGLDVIQQELEVLGCQFTNIVNLNKQVYGPIYANIFRKLLLRDEAVGKTDASLPTN